MKTSTLAGILVVAGIGIGALLSNLFPAFPGLGSGWNGFGNPPGKSPSVADSKTDKEKAAETEKQDNEPETTETTRPASFPGPAANTGESEPAPEVVYVVIKGRDYLLRKAPEDTLTQKRATLPQVIQAVQDVPGDINGVRVKILQSTTGKTTTLMALQRELAKADIPREAIRLQDQPIDDDQTPTETE
jgi:hypothetical protein